MFDILKGLLDIVGKVLTIVIAVVIFFIVVSICITIVYTVGGGIGYMLR